ncbi:unnamed protein product [Soboliphyme baturini]|uniref:Transmembrane protein 110 n=1 Tax=Soboliphyme baturini TaxID=241478 RepID=A0A183IXS4_9BILA|nr:unnamed protein product [Soboliphyme baturini]
MLVVKNATGSVYSSILIDTNSHCQPGDLTDSYGWLVQFVLASLAFASLVIKRLLEPKSSRREWKVWFFDTSKQATSAAVIHFLNVFIAQLFQGDPCTWYVISYLLDSTLGLLFIYVSVKMVNIVASCSERYSMLQFGEYLEPPQWRPWFYQLFTFVSITLAEKTVVTIVLQFKFWKAVREVILRPVTNPKLELTVVMLVIPFFVNTLIFWVADSFMMKKRCAKRKLLVSRLDDGCQERLLAATCGESDLATASDTPLRIRHSTVDIG